MATQDSLSRAGRSVRVRVLTAGFALLALSLAPALWAAEAKLGDPAPPLQIAKWVKGGPVDLAAGKGNTVFVVEFWATWCPPCRFSIPHLTQVQAKYRDRGVVVVGVSSEDTSVVEPFVQAMGEKMEYAVAVDKTALVTNARGAKVEAPATTTAYMDAYRQSGIPTAFIVDKRGRVAWLGHPMSEDFERVLDQVLAGTYEPAPPGGNPPAR